MTHLSTTTKNERFADFKNTTRAAVYGLACLLLMACNFEFDAWIGNGTRITETRVLSRFTEVQVEDGFEVILVEGNEYSAKVTTDENLADYCITDAYQGRLDLHWQSSVLPSVPTQVVITVPALESFIHNGDGLVIIKESGKFDDIRLEVNGYGSIEFYGTARRLVATVSGAGQLEVIGEADRIEARQYGSGNLFADAMVVNSADAVLNGSGQITLSLESGSRLNAIINGSGSIEWWGQPSQLQYQLAGSGRFIEHRELLKRGLPLAKHSRSQNQSKKN